MACLSHRELDAVRSSLEKQVSKVLGSADTNVLSAIESNLYNGFDRCKLVKDLSCVIGDSKALRIGDKVEDFVDNFRSHGQPIRTAAAGKTTIESASSNKRSAEPTVAIPNQPVDWKRAKRNEDNKEEMLPKNGGEGKNNGQNTEAATKFSMAHIQMMMENAQRQIEERKKNLQSIKNNKIANIPASAIAAADAVTAKAPAISDAERSKKIAQLQEQIRLKLSGTLANVLPPPQMVQDKPKPLILDAEGRTVDGSGRTVVVPQLTPTLKANIRAKKRESTKTQQAAERVQNDEANDTHFHDDRIALKPAIRSKRSLRFHEPGKFQQLAERMRMKAQLEKLQNEISQIARKTGISSATKLALIAPKAESHSNDVPLMEWWDSVILADDLNTFDDQGNISIRDSSITNLIEHPTQMRPPNESSRSVYLPVFLTKKERKKLRRQNRREAWKEEQEKIRLGLEPPPEPKLRISNLMRVLGTEAVQDPTKIEAHVREQMAKRQKLHEEANAARKLTDDQRRDKKMRKLKEDTTLGVHVAVYRIRELQDQQSKKFKVETNAKQLFLTGVCVLFRDCCVVVVEGGPKQQKKYRRLMLHRIKWEEDLVKNADGNEIPNACVLVWEGTNQRRNFGEFKYKSFPLEKSARDFFQKHHVEHYWDLAYSGAVLEASEDS
ncbi:U4/U6 small nuclear ribonucleoprotein Prp3 isoform X2 [Anopheles coustani]|uniref:U4/U6 small nuclear ribonucleoprotein Prp3 isoform X2 n=2 Tax=coustani group TaxID=59130 RepID=UPI00265B4EDE|nr:U4/U6 small nuclear ribonucleoprotein Prp3 isoform X2 [Anopheles coustani]